MALYIFNVVSYCSNMSLIDQNIICTVLFAGLKTVQVWTPLLLWARQKWLTCNFLSLSDISWFENNIFPNDSCTTLYVEDRAARLCLIIGSFHFLWQSALPKVISVMLIHSLVTWKWMWIETRCCRLSECDQSQCSQEKWQRTKGGEHKTEHIQCGYSISALL